MWKIETSWCESEGDESESRDSNQNRAEKVYHRGKYIALIRIELAMEGLCLEKKCSDIYGWRY